MEHQRKESVIIKLLDINIYPESIEGPWKKQDVPEIVDFGVLEKYCHMGIGTILMNQERIAAQYE